MHCFVSSEIPFLRQECLLPPPFSQEKDQMGFNVQDNIYTIWSMLHITPACSFSVWLFCLDFHPPETSIVHGHMTELGIFIEHTISIICTKLLIILTSNLRRDDLLQYSPIRNKNGHRDQVLSRICTKNSLKIPKG
jgi:hypothetical protein